MVVTRPLDILRPWTKLPLRHAKLLWGNQSPAHLPPGNGSGGRRQRIAARIKNMKNYETLGVTVAPPAGTKRTEAQDILLAAVARKLWGRWAKVECVHSGLPDNMPGVGSPRVWWSVEFIVRWAKGTRSSHVACMVCESEVLP